MLRILASVLVLCSFAFADHGVGDGDYTKYDLTSFEAGQWEESESLREFTDRNGNLVTERSCFRQACVKVEEGQVWMEQTAWEPAHPDRKTVTLVQIDVKSAKVVKAWRGSAGGEGKEIKVYQSLQVMRENLEGTKVTGEVTSEKLTIAGKEIDAQKVVVTTVEPGENGDRSIETLWVSEDLPFRERSNASGALKHLLNGAKLDHPIEMPAALAAVARTYPGGKSSTTVTGFGTDAKPTLTVK